ncbi:SH3 domain-containing protein [Maribacter sp. SA7]|uniref:SH3 domain-containing protein n=1 Tax=Maribacter zhoushanensis TaxID=3030012 RepID=UPI0023ED5EB9|nr:SH3 domain-containing protein [Maribacter zhoushanensis]MDF4204348.1 SH3 domain-containing protein [Maribacter zhoushanensis]
MKIVFTIIFLIFASTILGQETSFVSAENGLIVRKNPDQTSEKIGKLCYGTEVTIIKETEIGLKIVDAGKTISGQWFEIQELVGNLKGFVFSGYLTGDEIFTLKNPNVSILKGQLDSEQITEVIYNYLSNNYHPVGEKFQLEYYDWDKSKICSFTQEFKTGIKYSLYECKEGGGITVELELPKTNRNNLMNWIEGIYEVDNSDIDPNVWKENNTKFEPKEINPGCYYKIEEKDNSTFVGLFCGC